MENIDCIPFANTAIIDNSLDAEGLVEPKGNESVLVYAADEPGA